MKTYELLSSDNSWLLIPDCVTGNIKELWVLKSTKKRKKYFYRFKKPLKINDFSDIFDDSDIDNTCAIIPEYEVQKGVKYYCKEGSREEIYFI